MREYNKNMDFRMCDYLAYYDLIAQNLPNNSRIVEVGNADGASAIYLAESILNKGKVIDKFFWVDSMAYGKYNQMKTIYENIIKSDLGQYVEVVPLDSVKASKLFNGNSLDFVFLDSSHSYLETKKEIKNWYGKVKDEGYLAGHDFFSAENPGVQQAVKEMLPETIQRETIDNREADHYQEFQPEQFLVTQQTERGNGIWVVKKRFYYSIK